MFQCPIPSTINPATANGFRLSITKLPNIEFYCQEANVPSVTLPPINTNLRLSSVPVQGDVPNFDLLRVTFMIDEYFTNYKSVLDWIIGLGFPENTDQFRSFMRRYSQQDRTDLSRGFSDATLQILSPKNNPAMTVHFVDMYPIRLENLQMSSKLNTVSYLAGIATFAYNYFEIV